MTEEERLEVELRQKQKKAKELERQVKDEFDRLSLMDEKTFIDEELKKAEKRLWEALKENPELVDKIATWIQDHSPCSVCGALPSITSDKIGKDWIFLCERCAKKVFIGKSLLKIYKHDGTILYEFDGEKNDYNT